jgi:ADP-heptose:LPS heptosyltransferase
MEILIIRFSALGDLVTLEPTFRALRHFHRDDHITFLTSHIGRELYEDAGYFDRIVVEHGASRGQLLQRARELRRQLGSERLEIVYNLQSSSLSHLLTLLLSKKRVVNISATPWQKLLSIKIPFRRFPELLQAAGFSAQTVADYALARSSNVIALGADARLAAEYQSTLAAVGAARSVVALAPGASPRWESKRWGDEHFAELASRLQDAGFLVIVVGSNTEKAVAGLILERAGNSLDFTGQTKIGQLKALLSTAAVLVGNDSGPCHIAAAVGTSTVTLLASTGSTHCVKNLPYRGTHVCLSADSTVCKVCYDPQCMKSRECMATIGVDLVLAAALDLARPRSPE